MAVSMSKAYVIDTDTETYTRCCNTCDEYLTACEALDHAALGTGHATEALA